MAMGAYCTETPIGQHYPDLYGTTVLSDVLKASDAPILELLYCCDPHSSTEVPPWPHYEACLSFYNYKGASL